MCKLRLKTNNLRNVWDRYNNWNFERSEHFLIMIVKCWYKALSFYSGEPLYKTLLEFIKCFVLKTLYSKSIIRISVQRLKCLKKRKDTDDKAYNQKKNGICRKISEFSAKIINMFMYPFLMLHCPVLAKSHGSWSKSHVN